jgi:hypothetical protein
MEGRGGAVELRGRAGVVLVHLAGCSACSAALGIDLVCFVCAACLHCDGALDVCCAALCELTYPRSTARTSSVHPNSFLVATIFHR